MGYGKGGDAVAHVARDLIDLERYPIDRACDARDALIKSVRADLARDGCAVIKGFLTPEGIDALRREADRVADKGHRSFNRTNAYFTQDDSSLPEDDPRRQFFDRSNTFIPADNFAADGPLRCVHDSAGFDAFIQDCLQEENFFRYADPLADVIVNMAEEGNGFPWHFDTNNFTVTLAIQNAEEGGAFEYAAAIREEGENFEEVSRVLAGTSDRVTVLELEPGDLQLFRGRYSLHRVAPLKGATRRYVAIFSYVEEPGMVGSPERTKQLYGRVLPIHLERAGLRADSYLD
nr:phytanoyl-CoA dioxygenase family protein [Shimia sp. CNT1-13L.2]